MNTIQNKKGSKGFIVIGSKGFDCGRLYSLTRHFAQTHKFIVRPIEVKSCGKKQMAAVYLDDGSNAKRLFQPDEKIFKTELDAKEYCDYVFNRHLDVFNNTFDGEFNREVERLKKGLRENPNYSEEWGRSIYELNEVKCIVESGGLDYMVLNHKDFLELTI